ncbi:MAG TPA: hypothetical protein VKU41_18975 [Polyangiaceae bacterium]|nr:hypothetical protein [Polyangiaceae bacterium]
MTCTHTVVAALVIVMATFANYYRLPQAAGALRANLESKAKFIQIDSPCTDFTDAIFVAPALMQAHGYETALRHRR